MTTHSITITFAGICTHFRGVVPGVPHRVVLPNATGIHFGLLRTQHGFIKTEKGLEPTKPKPGSFGSYYLLPHFPVVLEVPKVENVGTLGGTTVPNLIENGVIVSGARLQIANPAAGQPLHENLEGVPSIRDFVPDYQFSQEVVLGERAAAYFDIFAGTVSAHNPNGASGATGVKVKIETDGPPMLLVTPFGGAGSSVEPILYPIPSGYDLTVANIDVDPYDDDKPYDFLLHYLTSNRGIPQLLSGAKPEVLPGLWVDKTGALPRTSHPVIAERLTLLAVTIATGIPTPEQMIGMGKATMVLGVSCSDSQYP